MIFLTKGNAQNLGGLAVPNGSLQLVLQTDCTVIATPFGQVLSGIPKKFTFDSTGNLLGTCQIWSNAELSPSTGYLVNFYDADGARINANPFVWVFSQTIGQSVDIGTMVSTSASGPSYSGAVLLNPAAPQSGNINITGTITAGSYTNNLSAFAATTSAQLAGIISDEVGSGPLAFATNTPLTNPTIDTINQKAATAFALKDNLGSTRVSMPSGGITQGAINNFNFTGAATANTILVLNAQGAVGPLTGNSADQVVYTFSIPANTIETNNKSINVRCSLTHTTGTVNTTIKVNLNGVNIASLSSGTTASQSTALDVEILRTGTTTGGTFGIVAAATGSTGAFSIAATGLAWTSAQTLTITFNVAATDTWTGNMFMVKQVQ